MFDGVIISIERQVHHILAFLSNSEIAEIGAQPGAKGAQGSWVFANRMSPLSLTTINHPFCQVSLIV